MDFSDSPPASSINQDRESPPERIFIAIKPVGNLSLPGETRGIIPDVTFHPSGEMLAATCWAENRILIYTFANSVPQLKQTIAGDAAGFENAHSVSFSPSGDRMIVNSYLDKTFLLFRVYQQDVYVSTVPEQVITTPDELKAAHPHSMDITSDGNHLVCAYCDGDRGDNKVIVYRVDHNASGCDFSHTAVLAGEDIEYANPKGVAFAPDDRAILVTLSDTDNVVLHDFEPESGQLNTDPRQVLRNPESRISKPEDVCFSGCGSYFLITNSRQDNIGFYNYDKRQRQILNVEPVFNIGRPEVVLNYPHGLDISPDGRTLAVTDYGYYPQSHLVVNPDDQPAKVSFYEISHQLESAQIA